MDDEPEVMFPAVVALGLIGKDARPAVPRLSLIVKDKNKDQVLRYHAAVATGRIGDLSPLVEVLGDDPPPGWAFGAGHDRSARQAGYPGAGATAQESGRVHRRRAAMILGVIGADSNDADTALSRAMQDEDKTVRQAANQGQPKYGTNHSIPLYHHLPPFARRAGRETAQGGGDCGGQT